MKNYLKVKNVLDQILALILLIVLFPLMLIIGIIIKMESKGPVIFIQDRLGYRGEPFKFYKFRSMVKESENRGSGVYSFKGDSRITRFGRIIRAASLDELPQLWNIIKGEMNFIGPRPTIINHPWPLEEYTDFQKKRFTVRPGMTGLAQINGRREILWKERIEWDIKYIHTMSFKMDLYILYKTIGIVFGNKKNHNIKKTNEK